MFVSFYYSFRGINVFFAALKSEGVDISKPLVFCCGGGIVSPLVTFALYVLGVTSPVYDAS